MSAQTFVDRIAGKRTDQAPKPSDDLALTSLGTLLSEPDDAVEWLIDGLIASSSVNMLAGKLKARKSTLARQMAFCLATGTPFIGRPVLGGPVWYLVLEDKRAEVRVTSAHWARPAWNRCDSCSGPPKT